ncbi:glutamyl-tRNA amidotransferase [Porphyromonadaceae bacterium COT-184 OH4590]|nr:glutamyl-tRNA amidotransferase [Porphyromonadaceae bacterium COT-184 OH4590]
MTIFDRISDDIKKAMIAQNKVELLALRNIKKELIEAKTSKEVAGNLTDEIALRIISKIVKQNKDAATVFIEQNRSDLAEEYMAQAEVIQRYMPAQMSDSELTVAVKEIISHTGACSLKDLGKVMGVASKQLAGKAEGRAISDKVKELLS